MGSCSGAVVSRSPTRIPSGNTERQTEGINHSQEDRHFAHYFGEDVRPYTMVLVDEVVDGGWGRADDTLTLAKMQAKK